MDSDSVLRGWVTDRADRSLRFEVEIFFDGMPTAVLRSDALDPKLVQLGEGDGRYAFSFLAPASVRDGRPHSFQVRVRHAPFTLKCKQDSFQLPAEATTPRLQVSVVSFAGIRGWLHGGQYAKSIRLSLWSDGVRLGPDLDTLWSGAGGALEFLFEPAPSILERLCNGPLGLAAPGMAEAGFPIAEIPKLNLGLQARRTVDGLIRVRFVGDVAAIEGETLWFRIFSDAGDPLFDAPAAPLEQGATQFPVPSELAEKGLRITAGYRDELISVLTAMVRRDCSHWVRNPGFERWQGDKPEDWALPGPHFDRSYFDFAGCRILAEGLTGDTLRLEVDGAIGRTALLRQVLRTGAPVEVSGGPVPVSMMVRANQRLPLELTLTDGLGQTLGSVSLETADDWTWRLITADIPLTMEPDGSVTLGLDISEGAGILELAGLALGEDFSEPAETQRGLQNPHNLVVNADLMHWPVGLVLDDLIGRSELARGWFAFNHRSAGRIRARALLPELEDSGVALAIAVAEVPEHFRLEIRLDPEVERLREGVLDVEIGMPLAARRLVSSTEKSLPEFGEIDRIQIVRRSRSGPGGTKPQQDEVLATLARRVLVTRDYYRFRLSFVQDHAWTLREPLLDRSADDHFLALWFRQPFAIAIRNLRLCKVSDAAPPSPPSYLALEDRHIVAQAEALKGLEAWVSPKPQFPTPVTAVDPALRTWRWSLAPQGGLSIFIHGAEATESALETMDGLQRSSRVPCTVHFLCGRLDNVQRAKLQRAIDGRPWCSLIEAESGQPASDHLDAAIRANDAEWILHLAAGDQTTSDWLESMMFAIGQDPEIGICAPMTNAAFLGFDGAGPAPVDGLQPGPLHPGQTPEALAAQLAHLAPQSPVAVPILADTALMVRRSAYIAVGGLNVAAFPALGAALVDLGRRVSGEGWRLALAARSFVFRPPSCSRGAILGDAQAKTDLHADSGLKTLLSQCRELPEMAALRAALTRSDRADAVQGS